MAQGYVRQAAANIQPGLRCNAEDCNAEWNQLQNAFDNAAGHDHTGSVAGDGAKLSLSASMVGVLPVVNGGTGVTTSTGSGNTVLSNAPVLNQNASAPIAQPTFPTPTLWLQGANAGQCVIAMDAYGTAVQVQQVS